MIKPRRVGEVGIGLAFDNTRGRSPMVILKAIFVVSLRVRLTRVDLTRVASAFVRAPLSCAGVSSLDTLTRL